MVRYVDVVGEAVSNVAVPPTLLQHNNIQVLAYYDAERVLTIADRNVHGLTWNFQKIDSTIGWDSHNYVDLGFDRRGNLHVAGNMHASPLQYWIVNPHGSPHRLKRIDVLRDQSRELKVTYPRFLRTPDGGLLFTYRDGTSGDGDFITLLWDDNTEQYERVTDGPLIHGGGKRNAYLDTNAPILGPDEAWHILWVWRDSPHAESTHSVNYARSTNLLTWTCADGSVLERPIMENDMSVVDPVPIGQGLINNNVRLGFLADGRPIAFYHKRDSDGSQQIWAAAFDGSQWARRKLTNWSFRWDFYGEGSLDFRIEIGTPVISRYGLMLDVRRGEEVKTFVLDDELTVTSLGLAAPWSPLLRGLRSDGLYDRCTAARGWAPGDLGSEWFMSHASVPEQRDQQPATGVPTSHPLAVIGTSPSPLTPAVA